MSRVSNRIGNQNKKPVHPLARVMFSGQQKGLPKPNKSKAQTFEEAVRSTHQWREFRELKEQRAERCKLRDELLALGRNGEAEAQQDAIDTVCLKIAWHPCYKATPPGEQEEGNE